MRVLLVILINVSFRIKKNETINKIGQEGGKNAKRVGFIPPISIMSRLYRVFQIINNF